MPPKRKAQKKDDAETKKKAKTEEVAEVEGAEGKAADTSSKGDVHIISSKACQAFAKRHVELEVRVPS